MLKIKGKISETNFLSFLQNHDKSPFSNESYNIIIPSRIIPKASKQNQEAGWLKGLEDISANPVTLRGNILRMR